MCFKQLTNCFKIRNISLGLKVTRPTKLRRVKYLIIVIAIGVHIEAVYTKLAFVAHICAVCYLFASAT